MLASGQFIGGKLQPLPEKAGFFPTGDLGSLTHGKLLVEGRKSELMITGGMKVFPVEIEQAMRQLPNLEDCAAYSVPDPEWGEVVWAAVVEKSAGCFDVGAAKEALRARLEPRKIPRHWKVVARIPRSGAGKILRAELPGLTPIRS
jgi:acyl-CoA synthetase (AMP-forming)/AMP-acid ligase II